MHRAVFRSLFFIPQFLGKSPVFGAVHIFGEKWILSPLRQNFAPLKDSFVECAVFFCCAVVLPAGGHIWNRMSRGRGVAVPHTRAQAALDCIADNAKQRRAAEELRGEVGRKLERLAALAAAPTGVRVALCFVGIIASFFGGGHIVLKAKK